MEEFGPYRLEELIGRGGMGEVFRAFDTRRRRTVALKRLAADLAADDRFQERFRRESELVAQLRDPHVIPIHDYGEIDGQLFLDMRLVDGRSLAALIGESADGLAPDRAVDLVGQVAQALDAAHGEGLLHRDVKPSNVLVSAVTDFAYLVDFGLARGLTDATLTGPAGILGTPDFMAPERFGNDLQDARVDVYALACVLWMALTGSKPFGAHDLFGLIHAHMYGDRPVLSTVRPDLAPLDDVLAQGMAREATKRFPTCGELAEAARAALLTARAAAPAELRAPAAPPVPAGTAPIERPPAEPAPTAPAPPPTGPTGRLQAPPDERIERVSTEPGPTQRIPAEPQAPALGSPESPPNGTTTDTPAPAPTLPDVDAPAPGAPDAGSAPAAPPTRRWPRAVAAGLALVAVAASIAVVLHLAPGSPSPPPAPTSTPGPAPHPASRTLDTVIAQLPVGGAPDGIALAPDGAHAYLTDRTKLSILDLHTDTITAGLDLPGPVGVAVAPDGTRVYVADSGDGTVAIVDPATARVLDTIKVGDEPVRVAVSPDGARLYVTNRGSGTVSVVDPARRAIVATVPVGPNPDHPTLDVPDSRLYVTHPRSDAVSVLDTRTNTALPNPPTITGAPYTIAVDSHGKRGYVTNSSADTVTVFDTTSGAVIGTVPVGHTPIRAVLTPDARRLYVTDVNGNAVSVIDTATLQARTIALPGQPSDAAISPDGTRLYVTGIGSGTIYVIDTDAGHT